MNIEWDTATAELMRAHAFELLVEAEIWEWEKTTGNLEDESQSENRKYKAITAKFLSTLIDESCKIEGSIFQKFWGTLCTCHPKLPERVRILNTLNDGLSHSELENKLLTAAVAVCGSPF
ncbi:hypothetical protein CPB83DRAFT_837638 [Crepidotus variabilis]|uniref:Uncharacterized protein n=1 Tax=Crepidotus variabilis TaxID=179855 RepID=A0A9P6JMH5_9AGAR|nr:hypothetical protein CPB83DRAFT_837638 [Crepidotus variabilis]